MPPVCHCGLFAAGLCQTCQQPVCLQHGALVDDRLQCASCAPVPEPAAAPAHRDIGRGSAARRGGDTLALYCALSEVGVHDPATDHWSVDMQLGLRGQMTVSGVRGQQVVVVCTPDDLRLYAQRTRHLPAASHVLPYDRARVRVRLGMVMAKVFLSDADGSFYWNLEMVHRTDAADLERYVGDKQAALAGTGASQSGGRALPPPATRAEQDRLMRHVSRQVLRETMREIGEASVANAQERRQD